MIVCGEVWRSVISCQHIILAEPGRQFGLLGHLIGADFRADLEHLGVGRLKLPITTLAPLKKCINESRMAYRVVSASQICTNHLPNTFKFGPTHFEVRPACLLFCLPIEHVSEDAGSKLPLSINRLVAALAYF